MKKWLIGIVLLLGVVIAAKQLSHHDYTSAKKLADSGNYQGFYSEIKEDVAKGDEDANNVLMSYLHKAIDDGDITEVKYYLENSPNLINKKDELGLHPIDVAVFFTKLNQIDMIKVILSFHPDLNYRMTAPQDMTLTEGFFLYLPRIDHTLEILTLLIDKGMNINNYGNPSKNNYCLPPLLWSYRHDKLEIFNYVILYAKDLNPTDKNEKNHATLLEEIAFSYVSEIQKQGAKLEHPADEKLWSVLRSEQYRQLHQNNMLYVTALLNNGLVDKASENELKKLFTFYASTGEMDAIKLFIDHGICQKYPNLCTQAIEAARINHFTEIEKTIKGK